MFEKGLSLLKKLREIPGKAKVLGTVAVFSPTFVACYGMPMDEDMCRHSLDCIDGYISMCGDIMEDVDASKNPKICGWNSAKQEYNLGQCEQGGIVFTDTPCSDTTKIYYPDSDQQQ